MNCLAQVFYHSINMEGYVQTPHIFYKGLENLQQGPGVDTVFRKSW